MLFDRQRASEPDRAVVVGKDLDDVRATSDLDALQRVGRAQLGPMRGREALEGRGARGASRRRPDGPRCRGVTDRGESAMRRSPRSGGKMPDLETGERAGSAGAVELPRRDRRRRRRPMPFSSSRTPRRARAPRAALRPRGNHPCHRSSGGPLAGSGATNFTRAPLLGAPLTGDETYVGPDRADAPQVRRRTCVPPPALQRCGDALAMSHVGPVLGFVSPGCNVVAPLVPASERVRCSWRPRGSCFASGVRRARLLLATGAARRISGRCRAHAPGCAVAALGVGRGVRAVAAGLSRGPPESAADVKAVGAAGQPLARDSSPTRPRRRGRGAEWTNSHAHTGPARC